MVRASRRQLLPQKNVSVWWRLSISIAFLIFLFCISKLAFFCGLSLWKLSEFLTIYYKLTGGSPTRKKLNRLAEKRDGECICTFARQFDCRSVDTLIIRAVYEEVSGYSDSTVADFPVRAEDRLEEDLYIHPDEWDSMAFSVAHRTRRSMENTNANPLWGRVKTVGDLVFFLTYQPLSIAGDF